ncbi:hypothetical protein VNO78_10202 [Psophocarpus tetragonolobus]|uniref:Uncharacterized protein n=1 Tax=Psophocarpus tetragonolobus TaxID=3891 RepID=A0AAN9SJR6_PSOTE
MLYKFGATVSDQSLGLSSHKSQVTKLAALIPTIFDHCIASANTSQVPQISFSPLPDLRFSYYALQNSFTFPSYVSSNSLSLSLFSYSNVKWFN